MFTQRHVQGVLQATFDDPVAPLEFEKANGVQLFQGEAADVKVPEVSYSCLHFCIMVFIDLLQSPLQPHQFRLPFPLQPANGLRHS
jgi:hypothetical protein